MSQRLVVILVTLLAWPVQAVATQECPADNWRHAGYRDGVNGQPVHWITRYRKACELAGTEFDEETYLAARNEGLQRYCRAYHGYELGARGASYYGACPAKLESDFLDAYRTGVGLHRLRRQIRGLEREIAWYEERLAEVPDSPGQDTVESIERSARLRAEIERLETQRAAYRKQLEEYKTRIAGIS